MSCKCQDCGKQYKVDWLIPDNLWEQIKPSNKCITSGLLCGCCIAKRIERLNTYNIIKFYAKIK